MLSSICLILSIITLAIAIITALSKSSKSKKYALSPFYSLAAGTFVSSVFLFFPIYAEYFKGTGAIYFKSAMLSLHNAIRLFVIDSDFDTIKNAAAAMNNSFGNAFSVLGSILFILAPVLTFGFVLSFLKSISSYIRLYTSRPRDLYIFSEPTPKSLALASSIRKNHPKAVIVFASTFPADESSESNLRSQAESLGAICFQKSVLEINFKFNALPRYRKVTFFSISEDGAQNVDNALGIINRYSNVRNSSLYVIASSTASEMIFSSKNTGNMKVRRINAVRSLLEHNLYDNGHILFETAKPTPSGEKLISALIVGAGHYGFEMIKMLTWLCQMDGYRIEINVFDKDLSAKSRFTAICPELMSDKFNGVYTPGEAQYKINFFCGTNTDTNEFLTSIAKLPQTTYAFVALGDDDVNVSVAASLRVTFERMGIKPPIQTVVYDTKKSSVLRNTCNFSGQPYDISYIGDLESFFSETVIMGSQIESEALRRHLKWGKEEIFWKYEYNYRSSIATAIHMKMRILCGIPGANKKSDEQTQTEKSALAALEHRRWNAYMRSEGFIYSGSRDKSSRNNLGKMHHDLVNCDLLFEDEILKDINVGSV